MYTADLIVKRRKKRMKLAVFDLDGTLVNSLADIAEAANYALRTLGLPEHELSKYNYFVGDGLDKLIQRILPEDKQDRFDKAKALYNEYYSKNYMVKTTVYDGIKELLNSLKEKNVILAVASNKTDIFADNVIEHYFGKDVFRLVCGKADGVPIKPDPAVLNGVIEKLDAKKSNCFMIGDTKIDIHTGQNAGVETIGCLWGFRTREELVSAGADHIAEKPSDILDIII